MTTATMTMKHGNGLGKITGLVLLILAVVAVFPYVKKASVAAAIPLPDIHVDEDPDYDHALKRHGSEAVEIRYCLDQNSGAAQIWRNKKENLRFYALCQLKDGRWGFRGFLWNAALNGWWEFTAFVPDGDGSWNNLIEYLRQSASRFKGPFPWEQ
jgi:hypothetical protein